MARASRFNKKQPAFDPSEITDLIFTPAVGTGVGSHLVAAVENFPALADIKSNQPDVTTVARSYLATVDRLSTSFRPTTTVDISGVPTVVTSRRDDLRKAASILKPLISLSTVAARNKSTVDSTEVVAEQKLPSGNLTEQPRILDLTTIDNSDLTTVAESKPSEQGRGTEDGEPLGRDVTDSTSEALVISRLSGVDKSSKNVLLWITEQGDLVPEGRVKRIRLAQDVINSAEESVYDTLWTAKTVQADGRGSSRVVQAGYDYLVKRTRLSKRTVQRIVEKLIGKDFITIERPADIYKRTSTVYRVFSYQTVLERHIQKGRSYVAKLGPGFSYVRPLSDPRLPSSRTRSASAPTDASTVANPGKSTEVNKNVSTEVNLTIETVVETDLSTMVHQTTTYIDKDVLEQNTPSSTIYQALSQYGVVDDDIVVRLLRNCKQQTPDCTEEEITHFIHEKGSLVRMRDSRIYSPIGFLLTAVPKCLSGETFRFYREEQRKHRETEAAYQARRQTEIDEWRREQEARLDDPEVSEQDKQFIREYLGIG